MNILKTRDLCGVSRKHYVFKQNNENLIRLKFFAYIRAEEPQRGFKTV